MPHFSLFVSYRPSMGLFISQQNTYSDLSNSDLYLCGLCLALGYQLNKDHSELERRFLSRSDHIP
jgi:hypothetical protein